MQKRLLLVLPLVLAASGAILWVAPQGAAQQILNCTPRRSHPENPLEMNTVVSDPRTSQFRDPLFKHVIMEKDVFDCVENPGTPEERRFTRDSETFIEIIQRAQAGRTTPVEKRVEQIVCDKGNGPGTGVFGVQCSATDVPLLEGPATLRCSAPPDAFKIQPQDPVEMNTAITSRQDTVKTMKVDKEFLACEELTGGVFAELYLFTEIVESRLGGAADSIRPTEKKFQAVLCIQAQPDGLIDRCHHFIPGPTNG